MTTNKKPVSGANRETGYDTAFDNRNHSPIQARLKALLIWIAAYDAALLALLALIAWRAL